MDSLKLLAQMESATGKRTTPGLSTETIRAFCDVDPKLREAIAEAHELQRGLQRDHGALLQLSEDALIDKLQEGFVNFYPIEQRNPYVALAARGPWLVTTHGAVIHDSGGYGMLGFGHAPAPVLEAMRRNHVMANIMTPSFSQHRLYACLKKEIGHTRGDQPFARFILMNSGSESVTVAARISDINAKNLTDPGARHAGKRIMFLAIKGGFHGRTERPAQVSSSSRKNYDALASFRTLDVLHTVEPNDVEDLRRAFSWAEQNRVFFEAMFVEPVMGEGDPGKAMTPEFYDAARELTAKMGTLLVVDSIQAGLRATGVLSICDYPGFQKSAPPDMETYSKALNAGQFPMSVLALREPAAAIYIRGVYGNTMTTNPRALEVACAVLGMVTPAVRRNIVERGTEFVAKLKTLGAEFPRLVTVVQGTGLLCSMGLDPAKVKVVGFGELEEKLRRRGIGVIHGGANALRFTPHFEITSREIDMVIACVRDELAQIAKKG
jgi:acetylornithine/succinyldiaminopimelate/putrescine aminotransferase